MANILYGGTKEEMQRLLKDAEKITGKKFDISNFADITEAIHAIQTEMGITGTTAKEASTTIQGSALAMKAAWSNFITGMADENANFDQLLDNLVDSVKTFMKNMIPRIKKMLPRLVRGLTEIAKIIGKELPGILEEIVPSLIDGAVSLMGSMYDVFVENISTFKKIGLQIIKYIYKGLTGKEMSGDMLASLEKKANQAYEAIKNIVSGLIDFGRKLMETVGPALFWIADLALDAFTWIGDNIDWILPVLGSLLGAMLAFNAVKKVTGIVSGFMSLFGKGKGGAVGELLGGGAAGGNGGMFSGFANMKPTTILKGMLNLSIVIGGLMLLGAAVAKAAPYIASLSDGKSLMEVLAICSAVGLVGTAMTKLASMVGNVPVMTVVKGLANIAIIMAGLSLLCIALNFVTRIDFDYTGMLKLLGIIAITGLVGSALAGLAGLIGTIPVAVVTTGLANIAIALGGFTAIVEAFGLLTAIPGFTEFLTKGGEVLAEICRIIGEMAGSIIGGIGEGITNSLPAIGDNISAFADSIAPAIDKFASMNFDGLKSFSSAFGEFVLVMAGEALLSWFTGGIDYGKIGTDLTALTTNGAGFFEAVQSIPEAAFTNATRLFECLNGIGLLPNSGGVAQWFTGEVDYTGIASGLTALSGTTGFFETVQAIPEAAFTAATNLFSCLSGIGDLPNSGGLMQWFTGEVDYQGIADGVAILGSNTMISALTAITSIPADAYTSLTALFDALAGIKQMPKEGGIFGWFTGDNSSGLTNVSSQLPEVASNISSFFTNLGGITDFTPISNLFNTLSGIKIDTDAAKKGFWSGVSAIGGMGTELSTFATNAASFFTAINGFDVQNMKDFFDELATVGTLPDALTTLDTTVGTSLGNLITTIETKMGEIKTAVETGITNVLSALSLAIPSFVSSGAYLMQGLNSGMLNMEGTLIATARRMATAISKTIDSAMKINSPSKVTVKQGQYVGKGYALGITETIPDVQAAANQMSTVSVPYYNSYSPETSSTVYNTSGDTETMTISPTFNLTISGSQDDRALARRVKEYVSDAIHETFASMDRKIGPVREA